MAEGIELDLTSRKRTGLLVHDGLTTLAFGSKGMIEREWVTEGTRYRFGISNSGNKDRIMIAGDGTIITYRIKEVP